LRSATLHLEGRAGGPRLLPDQGDQVSKTPESGEFLKKGALSFAGSAGTSRTRRWIGGGIDEAC